MGRVTVTDKFLFLIIKQFSITDDTRPMRSSRAHEVVLTFRTRYATYPGQMLFIVGDHPLLGRWSRENALAMRYLPDRSGDDFNWEVQITLTTPSGPVAMEYKYIVLTSAREPGDAPCDVRYEKDASICWDTGPNRRISVENPGMERLSVATADLFQAPISILQHLFFKGTFTDIVYRHEIDRRRGIVSNPHKRGVMLLRLRVIAIQVAPSRRVMVTGSHPLFKNWRKYKEMEPIDSIYWEFCVEIPRDTPQFDYKYVIRDEDGVIEWEERDNRRYLPSWRGEDVVVYHDWLFQRQPTLFKGAGLLVPLFAVHSEKSVGRIGEFDDLKLLIDLAVKANLLMLQLLPMQDVNCYFAKDEGSPSKQVSAFAFNPMYLTLRNVKGYEELEEPFERDFATVTKFKYRVLKDIFEKRLDKDELIVSNGFVSFVNFSQYWLPSYCAWCTIRDQAIAESPGEVPNWPPITSITLPDLLEPPCDDFTTGCLFHAWVQFLCHQQLCEVRDYAAVNRVVLSCALTIGQNMNSSDSWTHPELFDKNYTIGSPPDIFSFHGQNWFYPAWNWDAMRAEDFMWLRKQIIHREQYFQAAMFDHPLGLFRCWSIPSTTDNPLFGHFVPSIPIDIKDLYDLQIRDVGRLCRPLFPINDILSFPMSEDTKEKLINALATCENGTWRFRSEFESDRQIIQVLKRQFKKSCSLDERLQFNLVKKILLSYFESVCLIPDQKEPHRKYYPRYSMTDSVVFNSLPERDAQVLYKLFVDFYYRTNIGLWHDQGHLKLSVLANSQMQIFGYDLGVPLNDEEKLLHRVGICSFHVQRVPRESTLRFDMTNTFPYLSVCSPSSQDLPHLSSWWKRDQADVQQFYYQILKMKGIVPPRLTPEIAKGIIDLHMKSGSMWCVVLFEDLLALSKDFHDVTDLDTWINDPAHDNSWSYRLDISLNDLLNGHNAWLETIRDLVEQAQRGRSAHFR